MSRSFNNELEMIKVTDFGIIKTSRKHRRAATKTENMGITLKSKEEQAKLVMDKEEGHTIDMYEVEEHRQKKLTNSVDSLRREGPQNHAGRETSRLKEEQEEHMVNVPTLRREQEELMMKVNTDKGHEQEKLERQGMERLERDGPLHHNPSEEVNIGRG